jgi:hypothetical protein
MKGQWHLTSRPKRRVLYALYATDGRAASGRSLASAMSPVKTKIRPSRSQQEYRLLAKGLHEKTGWVQDGLFSIAAQPLPVSIVFSAATTV